MRANAALSIGHLVQPLQMFNYRVHSSIDRSTQVHGRSSASFQECVCSPCGQQYLRFTRSTMLHETKCSLGGCAAAFLLLLLLLPTCFCCRCCCLPPFVPYDRRSDGTLPLACLLACSLTFLLAYFLACLLSCLLTFLLACRTQAGDAFG